jgi:prepilin-type N-terminal cleavage/methylation domain-containing protein
MTCSRRFGFTLVELLIVITIVGLLGSLVGPYGAKLFDRARAQEERVEIERWIHRLSMDAFMNGWSTTVDGQGSRIAWSIDGRETGLKDLRFSFIEPGTTISISRNGIAQPGTLVIVQSGRSFAIDLNKGLDIQK